MCGAVTTRMKRVLCSRLHFAESITKELGEDIGDTPMSWEIVWALAKQAMSNDTAAAWKAFAIALLNHRMMQTHT